MLDPADMGNFLLPGSIVTCFDYKPAGDSMAPSAVAVYRSVYLSINC